MTARPTTPMFARPVLSALGDMWIRSCRCGAGTHVDARRADAGRRTGDLPSDYLMLAGPICGTSGDQPVAQPHSMGREYVDWLVMWGKGGSSRGSSLSSGRRAAR